MVAAVVGAIVMFTLGFLIFGLALDSFMSANIVQYEGFQKDPPAFVPMILSFLVFSWLISFVFDQWADIRTFAGGLIGGGLIMFAITLANEMSFLAFMNLYQGLGIVAVNIVVITIIGAVAGGLIGAILGKMEGGIEG
jgi:hypothetical protein